MLVVASDELLQYALLSPVSFLPLFDFLQQLPRQILHTLDLRSDLYLHVENFPRAQLYLVQSLPCAAVLELKGEPKLSFLQCPRFGFVKLVHLVLKLLELELQFDSVQLGGQLFECTSNCPRLKVLFEGIGHVFTEPIVEDISEKLFKEQCLNLSSVID